MFGPGEADGGDDPGAEEQKRHDCNRLLCRPDRTRLQLTYNNLAEPDVGPGEGAQRCDLGEKGDGGKD